MIQKLLRRRMRSLLFACVLLLGLVPVGEATADGKSMSSRTEVTFTSTLVEILVPGEEWVDEAGIYHFRGEVGREEVTGDITGELIVTLSGDFIPGPSCDPDDPDNCFEGGFSLWGSLVITDENGTWEGDVLFIQEFLEGEEPFTLGKVILTGFGGNAGKSIVGDLIIPEDEEDETVTVTGIMMTLGAPAMGVNMHTQLCFIEGQFIVEGAFVSTGAIESSGGATGDFFAGGSVWTHRYGLYGTLVFTDEWGSMTIELLGEAQDHPMSSTGWGHWVITGGTGAYAELYGHGETSGSSGEFLQCASGGGIHMQLLGNTHMN